MGACKKKNEKKKKTHKKKGGKITNLSACARAYVSRMCSSALFSKYVAFRQLVPVRESFVGSEYASVRERMCASVMSPGSSGREKKSIY